MCAKVMLCIGSGMHLLCVGCACLGCFGLLAGCSKFSHAKILGLSFLVASIRLLLAEVLVGAVG